MEIMKKMNIFKCIYKMDINIFYPEINLKNNYTLGVDYNEEIKNTKFTEEISLDYANEIVKILNSITVEKKVIIWKIIIQHIPLHYK